MAMSEVVISKRDVLAHERLRVISELAPIREKIRMFEEKYGTTIEEFEKKLKSSEESFEAWDDYIEWKAYVKKLEELKSRLREIEHAQRVRVA
jgi:septation ring formation regulator EzrA